MKPTFLFGFLASTSLASAHVHSGAHVMALAACMISRPLTALAVPVWAPSSSRLSLRQANSTTTAAAGTYTVVPSDTPDAIAAAANITEQQLEDANPGVDLTDLQAGQVLSLPASTNSNATSSSGIGTSMSDIAATAAESGAVATVTQSGSTATATQSNTVDTSGGGEGVITGSSTASSETSQQTSASACGSHHHHHHNNNGTATAKAKGHHKTLSVSHRWHNGTTAGHSRNSMSSAAGSDDCAGHHHNGTAAGETVAPSFFIPTTTTTSGLAMAVTSSAATGNVGARALGGFSGMLYRA